MTAISAPRGYSHTTSFERTLLRASITLDHFVAQRVERRAAVESRRATIAQTVFATARDDAHARGAIGILPR